MCFHSWKEAEEYERKVAARRGGKSNPLACVIMRNAQTHEFEEAYFCDVRSLQTISNTIRNLHAWHPGAKSIDLSEVNKRRKAFRLMDLSPTYLPPPTGEAPPSEPPDVSVTRMIDAMERAAEALA